MTSSVERNVAHSRGKRMAAPVTESRVRALEGHHLRLVWLDDITVEVEGQYRFNLAGSSWHRIDDPSVHGYLVAALVKDLNSRKPVAGRDSGEADASRTTDPASTDLAESATGSNSSLLLPEALWP